MTKTELEKLKEVIEIGELIKSSCTPGSLYGKDHTEVWYLDGEYFRVKYNDTWLEGRYSVFSTFERVVPVEKTVFTRVPM